MRSSSLFACTVLVVVSAGCRVEPVDSVEPAPATTTVPPGASGSDSVSVSDGASQPDDLAQPSDLPLPGLLDPTDEVLPDDPAVRVGTLDNGLRYYVRSNDNPGGKAELRLAVDAGSVDEVGPPTGVAHFLEHMLFNGTERFPRNELVATLRSFGAAFGADVNARTGFDSTVYELSVPADEATVDLALGVLEQWLSAATIDEDAVIGERGVVLDEWRVRTQSPGGRRFAASAPIFLGGTPYDGRAPIGDRASIEQMSVDELREYYDRTHRPDNAAVVVVGDIDVDLVEDAIVRWFEPLASRSDRSTVEESHRFEIDREPDAVVHVDPDQRTVDVEVTFPLGDAPDSFLSPGSTAATRADLLDRLALEVLGRRLDDDLAAGSAPFDAVRAASNGYVAGLSAPGLLVVTDADRAEAATVALLDEFERARRHGFDPAELEIAREVVRAEYRAVFDGRDSTQDRYYAEVYVTDFSTGAGYPSIDVEYAAVTEILESVTTAALDLRFRTRLANSAPHVVVAAPEQDVDRIPDRSGVLSLVRSTATREVPRRVDVGPVPDRLMVPPPADDEGIISDVVTDGDELFDPRRIEFANGVTVILNTNDIVDGQVFFQAASPGGTSLVADADLVEAAFGPEIVLESGVAGFRPTEVDRILAGTDVELDAWITPYSEHLGGSAATIDVEVLLQLIHLVMTGPQVDPVVVDRTISRFAPIVADPAADGGLVVAEALRDARYGGEPRYSVLPSPQELADLDADGVRRVWTDRFGNADGWVFVLSGDIDVDVVGELAARYLGTLPPGVPEQPLDVSPEPPDRPVRRSEVAGSGDAASVAWWFVAPLASVTAESRVTADVAAELVSARLVDQLRESAGATYAPFVSVTITLDPDPVVETYVDVSGDPARIDEIAGRVLAELTDLRGGGATSAEHDRAFAQVAERYRFVDNGSFVSELLWSEVHGVWDLDSSRSRTRALAGVRPSDVERFLSRYVPIDRMIEVTVTPR